MRRDRRGSSIGVPNRANAKLMRSGGPRPFRGPEDTTPSAPVINGVPEILGIIRVGETVTRKFAGATGTPFPSFSQEWFRGETLVSTAKNYTFVEADEGEIFTVVQTVTNSEGTDTATSLPTVAVAPDPGGSTGSAFTYRGEPFTYRGTPFTYRA